jgi:hypothetical protein
VAVLLAAFVDAGLFKTLVNYSSSLRDRRLCLRAAVLLEELQDLAESLLPLERVATLKVPPTPLAPGHACAHARTVPRQLEGLHAGGVLMISMVDTSTLQHAACNIHHARTPLKQPCSRLDSGDDVTPYRT